MSILLPFPRRLIRCPGVFQRPMFGIQGVLICGKAGRVIYGKEGSSVLDENHLIAAVRYMERNPVRAGVVRDAWEYPWSSAAYHTGKADRDRLVESDDMLRELVGDWKSYLQEDDQEGFLKSVRRDSFVNRPLGDEAFVSDLEKRFQLRLARGRVGRPVAAGKEDNN
jgi:putative transposase